MISINTTCHSLRFSLRFIYIPPTLPLHSPCFLGEVVGVQRECKGNVKENQHVFKAK